MLADQRPARYEAALRFLQSRVNYERALAFPYHERDLQLGRMRELLQRLGNPQERLRIVHVAGTKGKGSTTVMLAAVLSAAGYRCGAFTSPHLHRVEERIAVEGQPCHAEELAALVEHVRPAVLAMEREAQARNAEETGPTYFEITTAMALLYFVQKQASAAVLEVGLGGRLDSTNVCSPEVAVITSISLDHTEQLGPSLESIAREKAGIIKPGIPVVSGVREFGPRQVIREICHDRGCVLQELGRDFDFSYTPPQALEQSPTHGALDYRAAAPGMSQWNGVALGLLGRHQAANAAVVLATLGMLRQAGWVIPDAAIRRGLAEVIWPARVEVLARRPVLVLDAAHNRASIEALIEVLQESFSPARRLAVFATTQGKDLHGMLPPLLEAFDQIIFTRYRHNPRGVPPEELRTLARQRTGRDYPVCDGPAEAWALLQTWAQPEDLLCITGSFFLAAEMRLQIESNPLRIGRPEPPSAWEEALPNSGASLDSEPPGDSRR